MPLHRLFVGNIPAGTSEQELRHEFSSYGPVRAVDLKSKPNPLDEASVDTFAFVNIELGDDRTLWRCINEFRQEQYKGVYLNVSKAKESFLDRLKREREEAEAAKVGSEALNPYKKVEREEKKEVVALPALPTIEREEEATSSESSSSESEEEEATPVVKKPAGVKRKDADEDQLVRKWNQETFIEYGKLKIVSITGQVKEVISRSKNRKIEEKKLPDKARLADQKRKQGLNALQSAYEQQKLAIQASLAGGDSSKKKKIVFDDDDEADGNSGKKAKLSLFDNEDEEDGFKGNFTVRKQLAENTEKGQRLFEMQTQFHGDSRFKLDERFLADDQTAGGRKNRKALDHEMATPKANAERKQQLEILSKVTGRDIQDRAQMPKDDSAVNPMQRYDPSAPKSKQITEAARSKKPTDEEILEAKRAERPEEDFKVSDDKFYKVADGITQVLARGTGGFSLLSMFGKADVNEEEDDHEQDEPQEKPMFSDARFKYESSDSEEEPESTESPEPVADTKTEEENSNAKKKKNKAGYFAKQGIWKENFFFVPNDARLEEGRKFFTEFASGGATKTSSAPTGGRDREKAQDIRKIFKKRRMRETKIVNQVRARRGLKLAKGRRK